GSPVSYQRTREHDEAGVLRLVVGREVDMIEQIPDDAGDDGPEDDSSTEAFGKRDENFENTFLGCGDELEHRDGEDGGRHIVGDAFEFECGGDTGAYRHDLEDRRDDCGSGRNEQRADEKRKVPVGPEEKAYRERRADERDESTYRDESKRG